MVVYKKAVENEFNIRITPKPEFMGFGYDIRIIDKINKTFVQGLSIIENVEGMAIPSLFTLDKLQLQELMNELWNLGIRPSNGAGDNNAFEAVKYHLEDMRRLVFDPMTEKIVVQGNK